MQYKCVGNYNFNKIFIYRYDNNKYKPKFLLITNVTYKFKIWNIQWFRYNEKFQYGEQYNKKICR